jgi:excisionase family DNA binding protein
MTIYVPVSTAAREVGLDPRTLRRLIDAGQVPAARISPTRFRIDLNQLREFMAGSVKARP